jgi:sugar phosphate isomerase/epimerase
LKLSNYSLNYSDKIARGEMDVFRFLGLCRELGVDGASMHIRDLPGTGLKTLAAVRRAYLDQGLSVAMVTASTDFGGPDRQRVEALNHAREAIRIAAVLGAPLLRVFAGSAPDAEARPNHWARAVDGVRQVCDEAARVGLPIGIQNHNHAGLCGTGADLLRFVQQVSHANLTVVLDCGQFIGSAGASGRSAATVSRADLIQSIQQTAALARIVRVKFYRPRPDGSEPDIPYDRVLDILNSVHYAGFLDIVHEPRRPGGEDVGTALPRIVGFLRSQLPEGSSRQPPPNSLESARRNPGRTDR